MASGALAFGEPVLDTSITHITKDGPVYRGHSALAGYLAHVFEQRASGQLLRPRARYVGP